MYIDTRTRWQKLVDWLQDEWWYRKQWLFHPIRTYKRNKFIFDHPPGTYIEDCNYHPCIIIDNEGGDLNCWDMVRQHETGCSLFHCGIVKLTIEEAMEMVKLYKDAGGGEAGSKALAIRRGWAEPAYDEFVKEWKSNG